MAHLCWRISWWHHAGLVGLRPKGELLLLFCPVESRKHSTCYATEARRLPDILTQLWASSRSWPPEIQPVRCSFCDITEESQPLPPFSKVLCVTHWEMQKSGKIDTIVPCLGHEGFFNPIFYCPGHMWPGQLKNILSEKILTKLYS
jgi:hypothetical protein